MRILPLVFAALVLGGPALALELSLEENRTQRGSVGYVDMQRVFAESPDAATAKESFEAIVREAEERVNLKRAELLKLHQELDAVKAEREKLSKEAMAAPPAASAPVSAPPAVGGFGAFNPNRVAASTAPAAGVATAPPTTSTAPAGALPLAALLGLPATSAPLAPPAVAASTSAVAAAPAAANDAGRGRRYRDDSAETVGASTAAVAASTAAVAAPAAAVAASTAAVSAPAAAVVASTAAVVAPAAAVVASTAAVVASTAAIVASTAAVSAHAPAAPTAPLTGTAAIAARVLELDGKIITMQAGILKKEEALVRERNETDKGLVSIEGRKTDQVLVKIYAAITAVAHQEGVSIVVDRSNILYGHQGVDLTDKILLYLRSPAQP